MKSLLLILIFSAACIAQIKPCDIAYKDFPAIRGLRLGTSEADIKKKYGPRFPLQSSKAELLLVTASADVEGVYLDYLDSRVIAFTVYYSRSIKWNDATAFANQLSKHLPISKESWESLGDSLATVKCKDFSIQVSALTNNIQLRLDDLKPADNYPRKAAFRP